jgi:hypothetical protein
MANAKYTTFTEGLLGKVFSLTADIIKASLIDSADYTFSAVHDEYSGASRDVPLVSIATNGESPQLTACTITAGVFDTGDFTWTAVTGDQSEAIILWDDTLVNDRLMVFYDSGMTGMSVIPNGGNINVTVNAAGWFTL